MCIKCEEKDLMVKPKRNLLETEAKNGREQYTSGTAMMQQGDQAKIARSVNRKSDRYQGCQTWLSGTVIRGRPNGVLRSSGAAPSVGYHEP